MKPSGRFDPYMGSEGAGKTPEGLKVPSTSDQSAFYGGGGVLGDGAFLPRKTKTNWKLQQLEPIDKSNSYYEDSGINSNASFSRLPSRKSTMPIEVEAQLNFLKKDNERMQRELADAYREIEILRRENIALKSRVGDEPEELNNNSRPVTRKGDSREVTSTIRRSSNPWLEGENLPEAAPSFGKEMQRAEGTFVTGGAQLPKIVCENCGKEIDRKNFDLHIIYCKKNIKRCSFCNKTIDIRELDQHIESSRGNEGELMKVVREADIEGIKNMIGHGLPYIDLSYDESADSDKKNSILHFAAKEFALEAAEYFVLRGMNVNSQNAFGETPLHIACSVNNQQKNSKPTANIRGFVMKLMALGADKNVKNALGDTALLVAKRNGNHDLASLLN